MRPLVLVFALLMPLLAADDQFNGRWNIKVPKEPRGRAWWLEVTGAGSSNLKGRFVGAPGGSMEDIPEIAIKNGELRFVFVRQNNKLVYKAKLSGADLAGDYQIEGKPETRLEWLGKRAPVIKDKDDGTWIAGKPVVLFDGKDLSHFTAMIPGKPLGWTVVNGVMTNEDHANNLVSNEKFWNFKLHVEFRVFKDSNSGLGLRGRYEIQIQDDYGKQVESHSQGSLYSRIAPSENATKPVGEWQTMDVTLIGRDVTVINNGKTVINKGLVEGLTAMANDPDESTPGPIAIQGDHRKVEFRKVIVTPLHARK